MCVMSTASLRLCVSCLLLMCLASAACRGPCTTGACELSLEPVVLWDGGSTGSWRQAGPGEFVVEDGALLAKGGMGLFWYAEQSFSDFLLELEWRVEDADDNSGVFVRFPAPGDDPWVAVHAGYEIQICDSAPAKHNTGSVYSFREPTHVPTRPPGQWNRLAVRAVGQEYAVYVNGEEVCTYTGDRELEGYIGLQNHDDGSPVRYRNLRVTRL
jgi:hypothetical protein